MVQSNQEQNRSRAQDPRHNRRRGLMLSAGQCDGKRHHYAGQHESRSDLGRSDPTNDQRDPLANSFQAVAVSHRTLLSGADAVSRAWLEVDRAAPHEGHPGAARDMPSEKYRGTQATAAGADRLGQLAYACRARALVIVAIATVPAASSTVCASQRRKAMLERLRTTSARKAARGPRGTGRRIGTCESIVA